MILLTTNTIPIPIQILHQYVNPVQLAKILFGFFDCTICEHFTSYSKFVAVLHLLTKILKYIFVENITCIMPMPSYSHSIFNSQILKNSYPIPKY